MRKGQNEELNANETRNNRVSLESRGSGSAKSDKLTYLLVGGGIGALVALLFAPKSGSELRTDIADATRKGVDRTRDTANQLGQKSGEYLNTAKQKAGDIYSRAGGALNAAKGEFGKKSGAENEQSFGALTGGDFDAAETTSSRNDGDDLPIA